MDNHNAILYQDITDTKSYKKCKVFFDKYNVPTELLHELFCEYHAKATDIGDCIEISCNEDTRRVYPKPGGKEVELKQNNYVSNFFGERYFRKGYHKQTIHDKSLVGALAYIMKYDYKKLHHPKKTFIDKITKIFAEEFEKELVERSVGDGILWWE